MRIFNKDWNNIDEELISELASLEREAVIYTDHWQSDLNDFRHVRIRFTQEEVDEYIRRAWAYEIFLSHGSPEWANEVEGIPSDIAAEADSYQVQTRDGEFLGPPYHCFAAFLGSHLESLVCSNKRSETLQETGAEALLTTVKRSIDALTPSIRLFNEREKGLNNWPISREDDIRDLLYAMLRASISDIHREESIPSKAGTHKFVDLCSNVARLFIEVKWISKRGQWKQIVKQINDDIQTYVPHPSCVTLAFVIIDAARDIPDPQLLEKDLSNVQIIDSKKVEILTFVREP